MCECVLRHALLITLDSAFTTPAPEVGIDVPDCFIDTPTPGRPESQGLGCVLLRIPRLHAQLDTAGLPGS